MRLRNVSRWIPVSTLALIALFSLMFSAASSVQSSSTEVSRASSLFSILEEANATAVKVFLQLDAKDIAAPQDSLVRYNQALLLASEADSMMQAGEYSEACIRIIEALQKLKESLRIVYESVAVQPTEFEVNVEKTIALNSYINRFYDQLLRIENVTSTAKKNGFNTTSLETKTEAVKSLLEEALANINEGRLEAAAGNLVEAKVLIGDLSSRLRELAIDLKVQRLSTYIVEAEVRLETLKAKAISISNTASLTYVNQAENSLSSAKEYLEQQLINQTLVELANSRDSELQAEEYLKPTLNSTSITTKSNLNPTASP